MHHEPTLSSRVCERDSESQEINLMSETPIGQMRIYELRMKLKELGLSSSGTKGDLISRLSQYYSAKSEETSVKGEKKENASAKEEKKEEATDHAATDTSSSWEGATDFLAALEKHSDEVEIKGADSPVQQGDATEEAKQTVPLVSIHACPNPNLDPERVSTVSSSSQPPGVLPVNASVSVLEARCKRFGIPFDSASAGAQKQSSVIAKPVSLAKTVALVQPAQPAQPATLAKTAQPAPPAPPATLAKQNKDNANTKLEERRKRFGAQPKEEKEKEKSSKKSAPPKLLFRDCSEEERKLLEARMKRFGLL